MLGLNELSGSAISSVGTVSPAPLPIAEEEFSSIGGRYPFHPIHGRKLERKLPIAPRVHSYAQTEQAAPEVLPELPEALLDLQDRIDEEVRIDLDELRRLIDLESARSAAVQALQEEEEMAAMLLLAHFASNRRRFGGGSVNNSSRVFADQNANLHSALSMR